MVEYLKLLDHVLTNGVERFDRTGVGTKSVFGYQMRFNLEDGFPLVTTKKIHFKSVVYELLWFLKGDTNVKYLQDNGVTIWNEWADNLGDLGPIYGKQWRFWEGADGKVYDQISDAIKLIKNSPDSRRIIVNSWNVSDLYKMALSPCHCLFQFYVSENKLSCQLYQRSADVFLGIPFNIASYSLLTLILSNICGLTPGYFIHTLGDAHLYLNHINQAKIQIKRTPFPLPNVLINRKIDSVDSLKFEDFDLTNYNYHPAIKAPIAV